MSYQRKVYVMHEHPQIEETEKSSVRIATIIGIISVVLNLLLGLSKIIIGKIMDSSAVFSDGIHGTGDVLTTIIAVVSVWIAARKKNNHYNYGYERWASISSLILSIILFATAVEIITESTASLIESESSTAEPYSAIWWASMSLALASILLKIIMFFITMYGAKKAKSKSMKVDAWHQIIDALSSVAAVIALVGYIYLPNNNYLDPIFTYPISLMVILVGIETFKTSTRELSDHAIDEEKMNEVKEVLFTIVKPEQVKLIHSRIFSEKFYLDIYLLLDSELTLMKSDHIADKIKEKLFEKFPDCKNVYVIIEPDDDLHKKQEEMIR